eukprot:tig00000053_g23489.t1
MRGDEVLVFEEARGPLPQTVDVVELRKSYDRRYPSLRGRTIVICTDAGAPRRRLVAGVNFESDHNGRCFGREDLADAVEVAVGRLSANTWFREIGNEQAVLR